MTFAGGPRILFDTEFTTWEGAMARAWTGPGERREIIQIGAIALDDGMEEIASFVRLVLPVFNPVLSAYCTELTGITQSDIANHGVPFPVALAEFQEFIGFHDAWSYGPDCDVIEENCDWHSIPMIGNGFGDVRDIVAAVGHDPRQWSSGTLHRLAGGAPFELKEHNALDDCRSMSLFLASAFRKSHEVGPGHRNMMTPRTKRR